MFTCFKTIRFDSNLKFYSYSFVYLNWMNSLSIVDCLLVRLKLNQLDIYNMHFKQKISAKNYFYQAKNSLANSIY